LETHGPRNSPKGYGSSHFEPFRRQAEKTLDRLDAATSLRDLASFPGHHLEKLKGGRAGACTIQINDRWRICFASPEGLSGPERVKTEDYHD